MDSNRSQFLALYNEILVSNVSKENVLKVDNLLQEYNKGFRLAKEKEFCKAKSVLEKADVFLYDHFKEDSFEYYFSQFFAISSKSYLDFKMKKKNQAILHTKKGIEYSILLQKYHSSHDVMALFISQMLLNLAKIHLLCNELKDWHELTLENIDFLLNFSRPRHCQDFDMSRLQKTPIDLRYGMLTFVINDTLINVTKFKPTNGYEFIASIHINDTSDYIISLIDRWIKLNICISEQQTNTTEFREAYNSFLEAKHSMYDLRNFKTFLKIRMKEARIQRYELA